VEPQFKWLGDLTTPVRDLDVYQLGLPEMAGWLVAASAADLESFQAHLARRRAADRRILLRALRGARLRRLLDDWAGELSALAASARSADCAEWSAGALARADVARAHRRVVRGGTSITDSSPPDDLHVLRKRCKELRYALEMFAPVLDDVQVTKAIKDLKRLQDVLGRFQDSEVQRITLHGFAQEMVADGAPVEALLAMGELMGHLEAEQQRARAEFATAFASYVRPASRRQMACLLGSSRKAAR
jgi:CHAD domain-containing protein